MIAATTTLKINAQDYLSPILLKAKQTVNTSVDSMKSKLKSLEEQHTKAFTSMKEEIPGFERAVSLMGNPYAATTVGVLALGAAYVKSVQMAEQWHEGMSLINVTAQLQKKELADLSDQLMSISARNVAPMEEVPVAFNKIISAGLTVNESLAALEPTLRASKAGFTDIETTAKAAAAVMNSSGDDINRTYDVLFATLNKGNVEFKDIAQYLPKVIPAARDAGFQLGETAGAWAYLTAQGQTSERATTLIENAMKSFKNPARVAAFESKQFGVTLYDNAGKIRPLTSIIADMTKKMEGLTDKQRMLKLSAIGLDAEAASFFSTATQNASKFKETIDFAVNSAGQAELAYKNAKTPLDDWKMAVNDLKVEFTKLGETALPILTQMGGYAVTAAAKLRYLIGGESSVKEDQYKAGQETMAKSYTSTLSNIGSLDQGGLKKLREKIKSDRASAFGFYKWEVNKNSSLDWMDKAKVMFGPSYITEESIKAEKNAQSGYSNQYAKGKYDYLNSLYNNLPGMYRDAKTKNSTNTTNGNTPVSDPTTKVSSSAQQNRNITVNIDSFNKGGINVNQQSISSMTPLQIESWFSEMMLRVVRDVELSI